MLADIIEQAKLLKEERKKITSLNLALVLVHDILFCSGIQAGDGPIKQAVLRHKTRLCAELQKLKIKRGVKSNEDLAQSGDVRAGRWAFGLLSDFHDLTCIALIPRYVRVNTLLWSIEEAVQHFVSKGFVLLKDEASS